MPSLKKKQKKKKPRTHWFFAACAIDCHVNFPETPATSVIIWLDLFYYWSWRYNSLFFCPNCMMLSIESIVSALSWLYYLVRTILCIYCTIVYYFALVSQCHVFVFYVVLCTVILRCYHPEDMIFCSNVYGDEYKKTPRKSKWLDWSHDSLAYSSINLHLHSNLSIHVGSACCNEEMWNKWLGSRAFNCV